MGFFFAVTSLHKLDIYRSLLLKEYSFFCNFDLFCSITIQNLCEALYKYIDSPLLHIIGMKIENVLNRRKDVLPASHSSQGENDKWIRTFKL